MRMLKAMMWVMAAMTWAQPVAAEPLVWSEQPRLVELPVEVGIGAVRSRSLWVSPRGIVRLGEGLPAVFDARPGAISGLAGNALIAPYWADLAGGECEGLDDPGVMSATLGRGPAEPDVTIRWENMPQADCGDEGRSTFEVALKQTAAGGLQIAFTYESLGALRADRDANGVVAEPRAGIKLAGAVMELFPDAEGKTVIDRAALLMNGGSEGVRDQLDATGRWVIELSADGALVGDGDFDGVRAADNCPNDANPRQVNTDRAREIEEELAARRQGIEPPSREGDACDHDDDGDGLRDDRDNCPLTPSGDLTDTDRDGQGDVCDDDDDGDGFDDVIDLCPLIIDPDQLDLDGDGRGDPCDVDDDGDVVLDLLDNCVGVFNPGQFDRDHDRRGDACDGDPDGDGVPTVGRGGRRGDICPWIHDPAQGDHDGDGLGDACDLRPDLPCVDDCAMVQGDADGDRVPDRFDKCPLAFDPAQADKDWDGRGDACDADADGDGTVDVADGRCFISLLGPWGACEWMQSTDEAWKDEPKPQTEAKE